MNAFVYILASRKHGTLYVGVTSDLPKRMYEHRTGLIPGFTSEHGIRLLVYFEPHDCIEAAIFREKRLKKWRRDWKIALIERDNLEWGDLAVSLLGFDAINLPKVEHRTPGMSRDPRRRGW